MSERVVCITIADAEAINEALNYVGDDCPPLDMDGTWSAAKQALRRALIYAGGDAEAEPSMGWTKRTEK